MEIAYKNDTTAWASVDSAQKATYNALVDFGRQTVNRRSGETLRGRLYSHVLSKRKKAEVKFSADTVITSGDRDFFQSFFGALHRAVKIGSTWFDVEIDGGDEPIEFLNNNKNLWEYTFVFNFVEPL